MNGQGSISLRESISPVRVRVSAAGLCRPEKNGFLVYGLKTRIRKGDEVLYIPLRLRFASLAKLWISMYHQAQSWKETRSTTIAFKSEVTKAKEVSVRSRML